MKRSPLLSTPVFLACIIALAAVFAAVARVYFHRYPVSPAAAAGIYSAFVLLLAFSLTPAWCNSLFAQATGTRRVVLFLAAWCTPYLIYAAAAADFRWTALLKLFAIAVPPTVIYICFPPEKKDAFGWQDTCVALLWVGFVLSGWLGGIWNVPVNLDFMSRLFLIVVASWNWTYIREVPGLGYCLQISPKVVSQAAINFALFAAIAIPSSLAMHFTRWNPRWPGAVTFLLNYLEIFLFIALLEELFFRGFLQNLLSKIIGSWMAGQILVSVLFGLFHIFHAPFPNWRYVALASVAGWFYGSAYRVSGSLMASSILHAAVDTVWRTWFSAQ